MADESKRELDELPPRKETPLDRRGYKTVTEYYRREEDGKLMRLVKRVKVRKKKVRVHPGVKARREWAKFGEAAGAEGVETNVTIASYDDVEIEHPDAGESSEPAVPALDVGDKSIIVCRRCGKTGDHWTLRCPYKDVPLPGDDAGGKDSAEDDSGGPKVYRPPQMRGEGSKMGESMSSAATTSIRVSNLSDETGEDDLRELFRPFGHVTRVYLARDYETQLSRGFAFVSYGSREDAERAMAALQGYGYDHLIMKLEWAKPSKPASVEGGLSSMAHTSGYGKALPQNMRPTKR